MKITSFYPLIVTKHEDELKEIFEALGFEMAHVKTDFGVIPSDNTVMKDSLDNRVELSNLTDAIKAEEDTVIIRVNVDDIEGYTNLLTNKGFKIVVRDESASAKYCMLTSFSGLTIDLCEHFK